MKIQFVSDNNEILSIIINIKNNKEKRDWCSRELFRTILDHAWINRQNVSYNSSERILIIKLKRHDDKSKARKKFLGGIWWINTIPPNKQCVLTVRDIEDCKIRDEVTNKSHEIIIGGIAFDENEIYIGAFCEYEEPYSITLKVKRINITLEDNEE